MSDKSPINSEISYCEFESDNHGEGVMMPQNLTTEDQRESSSPADVENKSQESPPSTSSMGMEQKPAESTIAIDQSESKEVLDLLNQEEISDTPTPTIPVIDLNSFVPKTPISRKDMVNMMSQARKICEYYQPLLDNLYSNIEQFGYCLSFQIYMELAKLLKEVQKRMETWSDALQQMAPFANCDSQQQISDMLQEIKQIFEQFTYSNLFASIRQKCHTAEWLRGLAVPFIGREGMDMDLDTALASSSQQKKSRYVFFHNSALPPGPNTSECIELFKLLISKGERCIYVDTSLAKVPSIIPDGDRIAKFFITSLTNTDYVQEAARKIYTSIMLMEGPVDSVKINDIPKDEQFELEIPCPKAAIYGGACSNGKCRWECDDCGKLVIIRKLGKDATRVEYFYCDCGQVPLTGARFRCKDADVHGYQEFIEFPSDKLADQLRYFGEKNLLILGETGVGKSTWINAFANYITFGTFNEAIQSENPLCLIPTSFPILDKKDLTVRTITIGQHPKDGNERNITGQTQTKMPKGYVFELKTGNMRMVDTPGMADTAGLQQDQQNFKQTLRYISTMKELNGIAILIDANQSRLTPAFKYCIGQLLTLLHKDAAKNIVFVFTKCGKRTNPGLALSSLRTYLEEVKRITNVEVKIGRDQVYGMENDAFKFIHEVKQGIEYTDADYEYMESSWSLSKSESTRLLQYIRNLEPHKPIDTISLNQVRSCNLALALSLANISQAIQPDITVLAEKRKLLQTLDANELNLETAVNAMKFTQSKISTKYSMFLKRHAIMTYNDAIEEYVLTLIDEEKRIAAVSEDNRKLAGLEDCLKAYREEKQIIDAAIDSKEQPENDDQQSTSQGGFQQQAQNHSIYGQQQNGKSRPFSLSCFTTSIHNPESSASSSGERSTFGKYCWTANRWPQLQKQQRNGNFEDEDASGAGQPNSNADVAENEKEQNAKDEPSSSTSSNKIP